MVLVGGILVWIASAAALWWSAAPLGHDEARFALDARDLVEGEGKRYVYVPVGMDVLAIPGVLLGGDERDLRALPVVAGVLFLLAAWQLARRLAGAETAAWTVGVLAGARPMVGTSADLLSDLPSAACLFVALGVIVTELTRVDGPRWRLVSVAPLFAAAFYLRYGASATIAIIVLVSVSLGGRTIARRPRPVIVTALAFAALLVPHIVHSIAATGSPIGILVTTGTVPGHAGEGLARYVTANPFTFYGPLVAPLLLAGLVALRRSRTIIALQLIAVAQIVVLGLTTHAQPRFVFVATVLLVILGVDAVRAAAKCWGAA